MGLTFNPNRVTREVGRVTFPADPTKLVGVSPAQLEAFQDYQELSGVLNSLQDLVAPLDGGPDDLDTLRNGSVAFGESFRIQDKHSFSGTMSLTDGSAQIKYQHKVGKYETRSNWIDRKPDGSIKHTVEVETSAVTEVDGDIKYVAGPKLQWIDRYTVDPNGSTITQSYDYQHWNPTRQATLMDGMSGLGRWLSQSLQTKGF